MDGWQNGRSHGGSFAEKISEAKQSGGRGSKELGGQTSRASLVAEEEKQIKKNMKFIAYQAGKRRPRGNGVGGAVRWFWSGVPL